MFAAYQNHPSFFTQRPKKAKAVKAFRDDYSVALRDFNTAGVVAAHLGRPLSTMSQGYYPVHGANVKVNTSQVTECEKALVVKIKRLVPLERAAVGGAVIAAMRG